MECSGGTKSKIQDPRSKLSEHDTVRAHRGIAPKCHTLSADMSGGAVNLIPYFWDFPVFDVQAPLRHTPPPPPPPPRVGATDLWVIAVCGVSRFVEYERDRWSRVVRLRAIKKGQNLDYLSSWEGLFISDDTRTWRMRKWNSEHAYYTLFIPDGISKRSPRHAAVADPAGRK